MVRRTPALARGALSAAPAGPRPAADAGPLAGFHPAVAAWFASAFPGPTPAQAAAWPAIRSGMHTLVAAPTGSGKTLTAFLDALDRLVVEGLSPAGLPDATLVVYVSPLKALSNDIQLNLDGPLAGIRAELAARGLPEVEIRTAVRTGDTPQAERARMWKRPPHVLVTTPESLYVLLGSDSGRRMLAAAREVIVDEIHAVAGGKRGAHLALSLERLDALCGRPLVRIGLSATQRPIGTVARFLVGAGHLGGDGQPRCHVVDLGHARRRDLALVLPPVPLTAVLSNEAREAQYRQLADLALAHRTTLVFVNTRRMAERAARHLGELLGRGQVAAHHGSLSREHRLLAEQRLKQGQLRVLVATASLELGIDIGDVDLVCQIGSPRSISAFLQRVGRSGHQVGGVPKGRLFPESRDDLIECVALLDAVRRGELDTLRIPAAPLDVLAQQVVAEVAATEWREDALFAMLVRAWPYAALAREDFDAVLDMLGQGFSTRRGVRSAWIHRDAVQGTIRGRRGSRTTAVTSGGTIPDMADYAVVLEPQALTIGSVNEDFAVESLAGDVFQLGNASYRILRVERDKVRVEDAHGAPPSIPFWLGEAPGRSDALSLAVSRLRGEVVQRLAPPVADAAVQSQPVAVEQVHPEAVEWLRDTLGLDAAAAAQLVDYLARTRAALGVVPTQEVLVLERFFDESGGTQLVIHSPYGSRINRAWGLALRKRFCRTFNFELQAAATEDAIVLSLSTSHSFPLEEVTRYLHANSAADVLVQALLDAPLFGVRWRWNATTALALPRFSGGQRTPPPLQRMRSEDLLATVFPDQVACAENLVGEREVPRHPLVQQTLDDCLHEAMDLDGWLALLRRIESGAVRFTCRELPAPSPLAAEVLNARPYAFLDDAPLEERRTQAARGREHGDPAILQRFGALDPEAIATVRDQAWPDARDADEMHEALCLLGVLTDAEAAAVGGWPTLLEGLQQQGRAVQRSVAGCVHWAAVERLPALRALHPGACESPVAGLPARQAAEQWTPDDALRELLRARMAALGPVTVARLAAELAVAESAVEQALLALQSEGYAVQGQFEAGAGAQWCERHLLARIHRYSLSRRRREVEAVEPRAFMRFLLAWQHLSPDTRLQGEDSLPVALARLEAWEAPAAAFEADLLAARIGDYQRSWLDGLSQAGRVAWLRLGSPAADRGAGALRTTPIVLLPRVRLAMWTLLAGSAAEPPVPSSRGQRLLDWLEANGAAFVDDIAAGSGLLEAELEDGLAELAGLGLASADGFAGLRALMQPASRRGSTTRRRRPGGSRLAAAGRWSATRRALPALDAAAQAEAMEQAARMLLARYGVLAWRLLQREADWMPRWRDLLRALQRLEARGEIRGGRFIAGVAGEQFALPEAVGLLRRMRTAVGSHCVVVSGADPVNLVGTLLPGARVPRLAAARVLYRDGVPLATRTGEAIELLQPMPAAEEALLRASLRHGSVGVVG